MVDESTVDALRDVQEQLRVCGNVLDPFFAPDALTLTEDRLGDAPTVLAELRTRLDLFERTVGSG